MKKRSFDKVFFEYPLCILAYCKNDIEKLKDVIAYCIVESGKKSEIEQNEFDFDLLKLPKDFDPLDHKHLCVIKASYECGFMIDNVNEIIEKWKLVNEFVLTFLEKHGNDAYCRIGKQIILETINGTFSLREFLILNAIQSIIGKKKNYCRITYDRISYCMMGYRTKSISVNEASYQNRLSSRQIAISVAKLQRKRLITCVTYFREKYYSSRIKTEESLQEIIANKKFKNAEKKNNVSNKEWARMVHNEVKRIAKTKTLNKYYLEGTIQA